MQRRGCMLPIEIGFGRGGKQKLRLQNKLCRELFIFSIMPHGCETKAMQQMLAKQIATSCASQIVLLHIFNARARPLIVICKWHLGRSRQLEQDQIGLMIAHQIQAMFIGRLQQIVVAINKLQILSLRHADATITCHAQPLVGLLHINQLIAKVEKHIDGRLATSIINHYQLTVIAAQREFKNAFNTCTQLPRVGVASGNDETHQRFGSRVL